MNRNNTAVSIAITQFPVAVYAPRPNSAIRLQCQAIFIASGNGNFVCPPKMIILGEVGLAGEVRSIAQVNERLMEAEKLGFEKTILPKGNLKGLSYKGKMEITGVETVQQAIESIR